MNKTLLKKIAVEAIYVIIQLVLSKINIFGFLSPAGLPFAFLRLYHGGNIFVVTFSYAISKAHTFVSLSGLLTAVYEVVFLALYYFAKEFLKCKKGYIFNMIFVLLSNVLYLYYSLVSLTALWHFLVSLSIQLLLVLFFQKFLSVCRSKLVFFKFSRSDYLMFSVMTLLLSVGLFSYNFMANYFGLFLALCPVVILCKVLPAEKYFAVSITHAVGAMLATFNVFYLIITTVSALIILEFKVIEKYFYGALCVCIFSIFVLIFKIFDVFSLISLVLAVLVYILIPNKVIMKLSSLFESDALNIIIERLEEQKISGIKSKLMLMSDTFGAMQKDFKFLVVGKINREQASKELAADVISRCCSNCENFKSCFYENINKRMLFENLMQKAIENEKIEQSDLSNGVQAYCFKSNIVVSEINQTAKLFHSYEAEVKTEDVSKLVISSELENFADIFANFSKNLGASLKVNERLSSALKEKLTKNRIDVKEVVISENESGIESVSTLIANEHVARRETTDAISKLIRNNVKLSDVKHIELSGLSLATFVPLPNLKINFSVSSRAKENKNGDSHIITKLSNNKYFVAIADGMGHGESANKISSMVLSLIKSMFEVGLDDTLILQSVNKLLLPAGLDNFTTLDACVIDLDLQVASFIKLGSSVSIIKRKNTSEVVACESLPIGIVKNLKPTIIKKQIQSGDMLFLASDGIVDSFSNIEQFKSFVNDSKIYNMQKYLDDVVGDAVYQSSKHIDDMTIIGINLLKN